MAEKVPVLYAVDGQGQKFRVNFGCFGMGSTVVNSVLQVKWREGLDREEGMEIVKRCWDVWEKKIGGGREGKVAFVIDRKGVKKYRL